MHNQLTVDKTEAMATQVMLISFHDRVLAISPRYMVTISPATLSPGVASFAAFTADAGHGSVSDRFSMATAVLALINLKYQPADLGNVRLSISGLE